MRSALICRLSIFLPDGAHLGELVDGLEAVLHVLCEQVGKLLEVEDLQRAPRRDLAHRRRQEVVVVVAVPALDEDGAVAQALREHLAPRVVEMDSWKDEEYL